MIELIITSAVSHLAISATKSLSISPISLADPFSEGLIV